MSILFTENPLDSDCTDYVLADEGLGVWITVDSISVYVSRVRGGVSVALYPLHDEMSEPLAEVFWVTGE